MSGSKTLGVIARRVLMNYIYMYFDINLWYYGTNERTSYVNSKFEGRKLANKRLQGFKIQRAGLHYFKIKFNISLRFAIWHTQKWKNKGMTFLENRGALTHLKCCWLLTKLFCHTISMTNNYNNDSHLFLCIGSQTLIYFVSLIICNKIVTLLKINVPSCQINVPPCQINDPPSQINFPHCQINVPWSNNFPNFLRQNHDPRDIYLQEGHIFVFLFDHVYRPLKA